MQVILARHDAVLHQVIDGYGGVVFKTVGDAFCAAFATATEALSAAVEIQRSLAQQDWQPIGELQVRIGLHTGAVEEREGDYFGPPLNRLARLLAAGHGGQILLSLATQELVRDELPEDIKLHDLGLHRLRDLQRPEHIYQVLAPGLKQDFPALRTLDSRPHNLPVQVTPFIGRQSELAAVNRLLRQVEIRLLTLTGPGGTGKTRLALQAAAELQDFFVDGVFWVPLAQINDPDLVVPLIAQSVGVREQGSIPILESLKKNLRDQQVLLVLDNFEQVTPSGQELSELLEACPQLKFMITSRAVLHLYGEHDFAVPPLTLPDRKQTPSLDQLTQFEAVRLFIERARAIKPSFTVTNENAPAVADICHRLDGLPLAIELAAARINLLTPQAMLSRLQQRLPLLTTGPLNLPSRQRTLRNAIAWSYDLLEPQVQRLLMILSVFSGGFTIEAVETIASQCLKDDISILDGLSRLADQSLIRPHVSEVATQEDEPRLAMLETIREFAQEQLQKEPMLGQVYSAHADYFIKLAETAAHQLHGAEQVQWFNCLEREYDNLQSVIQWTFETGQPELTAQLCISLSRFWYLRGYPSQGSQWLERLLIHADELPKLSQAQLLSTAAVLASGQANTTKVIEYSEKALALHRELGNLRGIADVLNGLGVVALDRGDYQRADDIYSESLSLSRQLGDSWGAARALNNLGLTAFDRRDYPQANLYLKESLEIARQNQDISVAAYALLNLGRTAMYQGNYDLGKTYLEESLSLQRQLGNKRGISFALLNLGELFLIQGESARTISLCQESLALCLELGDKRGAGFSYMNLGQAAFNEQNYAQASRYSLESARLLREIGDLWPLANVLNDLGRISVALNQPDLARAAFRESALLWREIGDEVSNTMNIIGMGTLLLQENQVMDAMRLFGAACQHRKNISMPLTQSAQNYVDCWIRAAQEMLDPPAFAESWRAGETMGFEQALQEMLSRT
jgi:predicted ATPase